MKVQPKDLIVGNWYRLSDGQEKLKNLWYMKFKIIDEQVRSSDYISPYNGYGVSGGNWGKPGKYTFNTVDILDIERIKKELPKEHPDLLLNIYQEKLLVTIL